MVRRSVTLRMDVSPPVALEMCKAAFEEAGARKLRVENGVVSANFTANPLLSLLGSTLRATTLPTQTSPTINWCDLRIDGNARQRTLLTDYGALKRLIAKISLRLAEHTSNVEDRSP